MSESMEKMVREARINHAIEKFNSAPASLAQVIREMMEEADKAQPYREHFTHGLPKEYRHLGPEPKLIKQRAVRSMVLSLKTLSLPALFDKNGKLRRAPPGAPAGTTILAETGIVTSSRIAGVGTHVIVMSDQRKAHAAGHGVIAMESVPKEFRNVEAATFGTVDIDNEDDAPIISLPVFGASMEMPGAVTKGLRFEIPRSERRRVDPEQLTEEISLALILGLARAADEALLAAIVATNPSVFSLSAAATQGLLFDELRALVGRDGAGAAVGHDGALRAAGIHAELTADMTGTIVGAWNRAGIVVSDEVPVHFERLGKAGALAVTAWATMLPLLPDETKFWSLA